jgi:hypothetical protein
MLHLVRIAPAKSYTFVGLALAGKGLTEQAVFDIAINTVRAPLVTVPGVAAIRSGLFHRLRENSPGRPS